MKYLRIRALPEIRRDFAAVECERDRHFCAFFVPKSDNELEIFIHFQEQSTMGLRRIDWVDFHDDHDARSNRGDGKCSFLLGKGD